ncbi:MAG: DUF3341 domain-containing protein [Planctomycetota bacterium]
MSETGKPLDSGAPTPDAPRAAAAAPARKPYGLLLEFETPAQLLRACEQVRDAGFSRWDAHSPFPVHGLDRAIGVRPTALPYIVLLCGLAGATLGLLLQWWTNALAYPFRVSGKPIFSLPANIPVTFETTILLSAIGAVAGMFLLNRLPQFYHPVFRSRRFKRVTTDRFFISIEAADPKFDRERTRAFASSLGPVHVEELED